MPEEKQVKSRNKTKNKQTSEENVEKEETKVKTKYGPLPRFQHQRLWSRGVIIIGVVIYIYFFSKQGKETILASSKSTFDNRGMTFECQKDYLQDIQRFKSCAPVKCGRFVTDKLVTNTEAKILLQMAKAGLSLGGSSGGASILDVHSGALSYKDKFVNLHGMKEAAMVYTPEFVGVYRIVKEKIQSAVGQNFKIDKDKIYLTHPTFFSKLSSDEAKTPHDEYWHKHVDKDTYESFHYTTLLYLSDYKNDFTGGRFIFSEANGNNVTIEPRMGRVSMFTSGAENTHFVEKVASGVRYAITVSFTCDKSKAIKLPTPVQIESKQKNDS